MSENDTVKAAVTGAVAALTGAQDDLPTTPIPAKSRDAHAWQQGLSPEEISKHTYSFRQQKLDVNGNPRGPQIGLPDVFYCVGENPQANLEEHKRLLATRYGPAKYFGTLKDPQGKPYPGIPATVFTITYDAAQELGWADTAAAPVVPTLQPGYGPSRSPNALYAAADEEKARAAAAQEEAKRVESETRLAETKILSERRLEELKNRGARRRGSSENIDEEEDSVAVKQLQQDLLAAKQESAETRAASRVAEIQAKATADKERLEAEKKADIARLEADKAAKLAEGERERERLSTTLATKEVEHKAALGHVQATFENRLIQQQSDFNAKLLAQQSAQDAKFAALQASLESTKTQLERKPEPHKENEVLKAVAGVVAVAGPVLLDAVVNRLNNPPKSDAPNALEMIRELQKQVHPPQQGLKEQLEILAKLREITGGDEERPDPMEALQEGLERLRAFGVDVNLGGKKADWIDGAERIIGAVEKPIGAIVAGLAARNVNPRLQEQARRRAEAARRGRRIQGGGPAPALGDAGQAPAQAPTTEGQQTSAPAPKPRPPQAQSTMSPKTWGAAAAALVSSIDKNDDPLLAAANFASYFPGIAGALAGPGVSNIQTAQVSLRTLAGKPELGSPAAENLMSLCSRLDTEKGQQWGAAFLAALKGN